MKFNIKPFMGKAKITLKRIAPDLLIGVGVVGIGVGVVSACKATMKVQPIVEKHNTEKEEIANVTFEPAVTDEERDTYEKKELAKLYFATGKELVKLYAPSVLIIGGSIGCILGSHSMMTKRTTSLAAAYATVDGCFKEYRKNVIAKYGEAVDAEMRHGIKVDKKQETEGAVTAKADVKPDTNSDYSKFFDEQSPYWENNADYNLMFLKSIERWANDQLEANGYLFLNDVYKALGIPKTEAGQVVGWIYDKENPIGDNYVDFRIYDISSQASREFVNGNEKNILLDFNVDGYILERVPFHSRVRV